MAQIIARENISLDGLRKVFYSGEEMALSDDLVRSVKDCRNYLEEAIGKAEKPIYGVNTGFGSLCNTEISRDAISDLQVNLVISHACGSGDEVPSEIVRLMLLLKIVNLSLGHSGIRMASLERLVLMYNRQIIPVVYEQGSLGASGDLAPLAHLSLPLIHRGEVWYKGEKRPSSDVFNELGFDPIRLGAKEGLALLNGTQFMSSYATYILWQLEDVMRHSYHIAAASLDAFDCLSDPFTDEIQQVRPHRGQIEVARQIRELMKGSEIAGRKKEYVQDPYSFRCIPQVHGASLDAINYVRSVVETELASVTDNPMIFPEEDMVVSAGNFHGQPLALSLDFLAIAIAELASISERRVYKLISGQRGLPAFLSPDPGLHSGYMIPQYTAASIVSQNKQLCTPSSVDTIDSSNGQEDHVSMGANAALKCYKVFRNYKTVLSIELMNASQALEFRKPLRSSASIESYLAKFRKVVPFQKVDDEWHLLMKKSLDFVTN